MAYIFSDGFDFYSSATALDASGWWDSVGATNVNLAAGRFSGSQSIGCAANGINVLTKASASNDATIHLVMSVLWTGAFIAGQNNAAIQLFDGVTIQCSIVFTAYNAILLTSGDYTGAVLATYNNAYIPNVWTAFEFEITINNTTGSFNVRKEGATSNSFSATGLNTRGGTANNYVNKIQFRSVFASTLRIDDLLWFSTTGAAPNTWAGDIRAYQLMPTSDASVQFSKSPATINFGYLGAVNSSASIVANQTYFNDVNPYSPTRSGSVTALNSYFVTGFTGHAIMGLYDSNGAGGKPGTLLATSNAITNPVAGLNVFTLGTPFTVTVGHNYYMALLTDAACNHNYLFAAGNNNSAQTATTYPNLPAIAGINTGGIGNGPPSFFATMTLNNSLETSEAQQDGATTYVYDSVVGHADLYNVADLPANVVSIVGITTRAYMEKSDAGARTGRVQLKSGATTVTGDLVLSTSFSWCSRFDNVDPNTSAAWTLANANAIQIGPVVAA